jgi:hypothetical protein
MVAVVVVVVFTAVGYFNAVFFFIVKHFSERPVVVIERFN